jgi:hypothetical protein
MGSMIKSEAPGEIIFLRLCFVCIMLSGIIMDIKIRCYINAADDMK